MSAGVPDFVKCLRKKFFDATGFETGSSEAVEGIFKIFFLLFVFRCQSSVGEDLEDGT